MTVTLHPIVPKLYMLLGLIPSEAIYFTFLDLKDAFFCIRQASQNQPIFAFQWESPESRDKGQLTYTRLPQGFKNSSIIFETPLDLDLKGFLADQHSCTPVYR